MLPFFKKMQQARRPRCTALVAAAGSSARMGGVNKLLELLDGVPVLVRTLTALQRAERVDEIVVATREEDLVAISQLCRTYGISKCSKVVRGGEDRVHSVLLAALEADPRSELLAVQDGARPLVTPELIDRVVELAARCGAAAPAVPVKDTIKVVDDRDTVASTPEQSALDAGAAVTDDCSAVERLGKSVTLTEGDERNLKITTPVDLVIAEALLGEENT